MFIEKPPVGKQERNLISSKNQRIYNNIYDDTMSKDANSLEIYQKEKT